MRFAASFDSLVRVITISTTLLFFVITFYTITQNPGNVLLQAAIVVTLWVTFILCYLYHPQGYSVTDSSVIIHRLFSNVSIPLSNVQSVRVATDQEMRWTIRTFGVGGLFGYFARFTNTQLGNMTFYCTKRKDYVLLYTSVGLVVLSPDSPAEFVAAFG